MENLIDRAIRNSILRTEILRQLPEARTVEDYEDPDEVEALCIQTPEEIKAEEEQAGFSFWGIKSWTGIAGSLETIESVRELQEWAKGPLFRPFWMEYYFNGWLPFRASNSTKQFHDFTFRSVALILHIAEKDNDTNYACANPDTTGWLHVDWMARLFLGVLWANCNDIDGIFYKKNWPSHAKENILWRILILTRSLFEKSRVNRPNSGGYAWLGFNSDDIARCDKITSKHNCADA